MLLTFSGRSPMNARAIVPRIVVGAALLAPLASACTSASIGSGDDAGTPALEDAGTDATTDGGSDSDIFERTGDDCRDWCAKAASANCPEQLSCVERCEAQVREVPVECATELDDVFECAFYNGTFECHADGRASVSGCRGAQGELAECMQKAAITCAQLSFGVAACDACMDGACCAVETACAREPECVALVVCLAAGGKTREECEAMHPTAIPLKNEVFQCSATHCDNECAG
jgi:hypothetical protein